MYRPRRAHGVYLVAQGLHFAGADDPRLDRFCRVLAGAGFVVVAPLLSDFLALRIAETATADLRVAFDAASALAEREGLRGPAVFSISFGSRPAIELCAGPRGERVSALVLFGGFCDFDTTVRFAISGRVEHEGRPLELPHDPLNAPVVHMNLLPFYGERVGDAEALARAMRQMAERTWGRPELKIGRAREVHARACAEGLGSGDRAFFFAACGLEPGGVEMLEEALPRARQSFAWADARADLARIAPPVVIVHGRDDDVIPWTQALEIARALPPGHDKEVLLTGLYGHTGARIPSAGAIAGEARALGRVVHRIAGAPSRQPLTGRRSTTARPSPSR